MSRGSRSTCCSAACIDDVQSHTGGQQAPFTYGSLPAEALYFKPNQ